MGIVVFLVVLGGLVVAHEVGHYAAARLSGIRVLEFGVGLPPRVLSFRRGGTDYTLNLLPLGGFVRMLGEEDPDGPESFSAKSPWRRLFVLAAGSAMNAALPVLLFAAVFMIPQPVLVTDVAVLDVAPGSPAQAAGILPGDVVRSASGRPIDNTSDLRTAIHLRLGAHVDVVVERQGRRVALHIPEARVAPPTGEGAVGVLLADGRLTVADAAPGSAAARAGLREGDLLLRVGGARVLRDGDPEAVAAALLAADPGAAVSVDVLRAGRLVALELPPGEQLGGLAVSVRPEESRSQGPVRAFASSFRQIADVLVLARNEISLWIAGAGVVQLSGPVGIAHITGQVAQAGLSPLITWTALLSINLAIINLLPIPALDGGRIVFVLLEIARGGRRLDPGRERMVHLAGFVALFGVIIAVSVSDVQRILSGAGILGG